MIKRLFSMLKFNNILIFSLHTDLVVTMYFVSPLVKEGGKVQVNTMRLLKIILMTFVLGILIAPLLGCGSESDEAEQPESQVASVQRGNLSLEIRPPATWLYPVPRT